MRHGIVAAGTLLLVLTLGSWIVGSPPSTGSTSSTLLVATTSLVPVAPSSTLPTSTLPPSTRPTSTLSPSTLPSSTTRLALDPAAAFLAELNDLRGAEHLPLLTRDPSLDAMAQSWAETLATEGSLRHSALIYDVIAGSWTTAGENVGYGPSAPVVFAALAGSPAHLANMVNPDFAHVGLGVVRVDDVLWTAHLFAG